MNNYEAIKRMNLSELESFMDQVYLTGVNNGMYAASLQNGSEEQLSVLEETPFNEAWLVKDAEDAALCLPADDGDEYIFDELAAAVLRKAGIPFPEKTE